LALDPLVVAGTGRNGWTQRHSLPKVDVMMHMAREGGRGRACGVLVVTGQGADGYREILRLTLGESEWEKWDEQVLTAMTILDSSTAPTLRRR
jgi:hypothetical protein